MKKDLKYYKENAEEDYLTTPISVLRYIGEVQRSRNTLIVLVSVSSVLLFLGGILIGLNF